MSHVTTTPASPATPPPPPAAPEDESADPVGDGHSDAELAARRPKPTAPERKGG